jgi:hypothetical protein
VGVGIAAVVYLVVLAALGLESDERALLRDLLSRLRRKPR